MMLPSIGVHANLNPLIRFELILTKAFAASDAVDVPKLASRRTTGMQSPRQLFEA
jgi:hypothetical protein